MKPIPNIQDEKSLDTASGLSHATAALAASELRYRRLFESARDGILILDAETGMVVDVNPFLIELLGFTREAFLGKAIWDLGFFRDIFANRENFATLQQQAYIRYADKPLETADGRRIDVEFISNVYLVNRKDVIQCNIREITERKQTETYREMSRAVLQILNEPGTLPDALQRVVAALKTRTGFAAVGLRLQDGDDFPYCAQEGLFTDFLLTENSLLERDAGGGVCRDKDGHVSLGCTCGLVLSGKTDPANPLFTRGGSFWTNDASSLFGLPANQDPQNHPRNQCIDQGYASVALVPIRDKDSIVGLIQLNDRRKGRFTLNTVEILEVIAAHIGSALMRKRAEEKLLASEQEFRAMFEVASIGMAQADLYTQQWVRVNAKLCAITGYSVDEMLKMRISELTHPADRQKDLELFQRVVRGEMPDYHMEKRYLRKDGTVAWVNVNMTVIRDAASNPVRTMATIEDITERKWTEAELQKSDKLQSIGALAGGIAHDFNNILHGLYGNIRLAKEVLAKTHPSYAFLEEAGNSMNRVIRLTKQLLTFAEGGDPVKESVSLGAMVEEVARFDLTGSNVNLVHEHDEDLWPIDADRGQLQQVVSNLVINACQAMPKGGHLHITLGNANIPAEPGSMLKPGRYVKVIVRDEGTGIDPMVLDHIFDPYFTTKQTGHGLGLATVWSIVNRHGGHIDVVSELGKGSAFTFYLPASASPQPVEAKPPATECPAPDRSAKILVMDDESMVCILARRMLEPCGYTVATATDGQETIALYKEALEAGAPFDVVIMDLTIPGGPGGKEVIKDLLALDPKVRAIVSSGYAADPVMASPAAYGFTCTVAKPYTSTALREAVARVLD